MRRFSETNYYAVLGVRSTAGRDEIKAAYRALARRAHPDRGGDADTFALLAEAWEVLGDPATRARYDSQRHVAPRPHARREDARGRDRDHGPRSAASPGRRLRYSDDGLTDAQRWLRDKRRL